MEGKKKKRKEKEKGKANLHGVSELLCVTTTSTGNQKMDSDIVPAPNFDFFFLCFLDHPEVELRGGKRSRGVGDILNIFRLPQTRDFFFYSRGPENHFISNSPPNYKRR